MIEVLLYLSFGIVVGFIIAVVLLIYIATKKPSKKLKEFESSCDKITAAFKELKKEDKWMETRYEVVRQTAMLSQQFPTFKNLLKAYSEFFDYYGQKAFFVGKEMRLFQLYLIELQKTMAFMLGLLIEK